MIALSQASTIALVIAAVVLGLALLAVLRVIFRKEPSPASWRRLRAGFFVERDPKDDKDGPAD